MLEILNRLDSFVWGPPLLILLVGTGIYLSLRLGLLQIFSSSACLSANLCIRRGASGRCL